MNYLKIENPGVAPITSITTLGASTKRGEANLIGKFGSGAIHGVLVLLRAGIRPTIYSGTDRVKWDFQDETVNDGMKENSFHRVTVQINNAKPQVTSMVLEHGATDWTSPEMGLREFVSNAIDRVTEEEEFSFSERYKEKHSDYSYNELEFAVGKFRLAAKPWEKVTVEMVTEGQVRAKAGTTRVFVPMTQEVLGFFANLGKWFLHFSEPESLQKAILPKNKDRSMKGKNTAVIYRRGVFVRQVSHGEDSLFDYNLNTLDVDECRNVDDWKVSSAAGRALGKSIDQEVVGTFVSSFATRAKKWEHAFTAWSMSDYYGESPEVTQERKKVWSTVVKAKLGDTAVLSPEALADIALRKGYKPFIVPESLVESLEKLGCPTPRTVLGKDDQEGREILPPTPDAKTAIDFVWGVVTAYGMTNGRSKPKVFSFRKIMNGGAQTLGFWRDDMVYLNEDLGGNASLTGGEKALSQQLLVTAMEEVAHHVTRATDNSRDFQDYVLNLALKMARDISGI